MCHSSGGPADLHKVIGCYKGNAEWPGVMCQVEGEKCAPTTGNPSQTVCTISFSCALLQLNKVKQPCSPLRMSQCTQRAPLELMSFKDVIPHTSFFFFSSSTDSFRRRRRADVSAPSAGLMQQLTDGQNNSGLSCSQRSSSATVFSWFPIAAAAVAQYGWEHSLVLPGSC